MPIRNERRTIDVDGLRASYLTAGQDGPVVLMMHGTYWSRGWLPVLDKLAASGLRPVAVDLPGLSRSAGELTLETATVPALTAWTERFLDVIGVDGPVMVAGHDIGGAIAQRLLTDSGVKGLARPAAEEEIKEYVDPWRDPRVCRSWMALAGAADSRYTLELLPALRASTVPKQPVWGEDDTFQPATYAERFATEIPDTTLVRVPKAGHIPMENDPDAVADALVTFFTAPAR